MINAIEADISHQLRLESLMDSSDSIRPACRRQPAAGSRQESKHNDGLNNSTDSRESITRVELT